MYKTMLTLGVLLAGHLTSASAEEQTLTFVSWGGSTQAAQEQAWTEPFERATGIRVKQAGPTDYDSFRQMVERGDVSWDIVDVEADFALRAGREGLLEPLDLKQVAQRDIDPRFVTIYAVGSFYFSFILGYNTEALTGSPKGWATLFDLKNHPGKRAFYKWPSPGVLEMALLADGVTPEALYPLDIDRAFRKLDSIKSEILWWDSGEESQRLLASGRASLGMFWNGRISALKRDGMPVEIDWQQNLVSGDFLVIPRGTRNKEAAKRFLGYASSAGPQADFAMRSGYAPVNLGSAALIPPHLSDALPNAHRDGQITLDFKYWSLNGAAISQRWYAWQAQ